MSIDGFLSDMRRSDVQTCDELFNFQPREYTFSPIQTTTNSAGNRLHSFLEWGTNHPELAAVSGTSGLRWQSRWSALALRRIHASSSNRTERL